MVDINIPSKKIVFGVLTDAERTKTKRQESKRLTS